MRFVRQLADTTKKYKYSCIYRIDMAEVENKLQRWGNSFGIVIPIDLIRRKHMREGEKIKAIIVKRSNVLRETFGSHRLSKPVSQLMKEMDHELYND